MGAQSLLSMPTFCHLPHAGPASVKVAPTAADLGLAFQPRPTWDAPWILSSKYPSLLGPSFPPPHSAFVTRPPAVQSTLKGASGSRCLYTGTMWRVLKLQAHREGQSAPPFPLRDLWTFALVCP